jgi:hypothetical protein
MELLILTLATLLGTLLALEAKAWLPFLSRRLIAGAVARFPADLRADDRDRWRREIESDLAAFDDRPLGGLAFALRVRFKGGKDLAAELALAEKIAEPEQAPEPRPPSPPPTTEGELSLSFGAGRWRLQTEVHRLNRLSPSEIATVMWWIQQQRKKEE